MSKAKIAAIAVVVLCAGALVALLAWPSGEREESQTPAADNTSVPSPSSSPAEPSPSGQTGDEDAGGAEDPAQTSSGESQDGSTPTSTDSENSDQAEDLPFPDDVTFVEVPDISGKDLPVNETARLLRAADLVPGFINFVEQENGPFGVVTETIPDTEFSIASGESVNMFVRAPQEGETPDVSAMSFPEAVTAIREAGLRLGSIDAPVTEETGPPGQVISQFPEAGQEAEFVSLQVPPNSPVTSLPDVTGTPVVTALYLLQGAGVAVGNIESVDINSVVASVEAPPNLSLGDAVTITTR